VNGRDSIVTFGRRLDVFMSEVRMAHPPGSVRDAIAKFFQERRDPEQPASVSEIRDFVELEIGDVPKSSVRSYLQIGPYERVERGAYRRRAD
jgi:hypothetical protein